MAGKRPVIVCFSGFECLTLSDKLKFNLKSRGATLLKHSQKQPQTVMLQCILGLFSLSFLQQNCLQEYSKENFDKTSDSSIAVGSLVQKMVSRVHGFSESMVDDRFPGTCTMWSPVGIWEGSRSWSVKRTQNMIHSDSKAQFGDSISTFTLRKLGIFLLIAIKYPGIDQ